MALAGVRLRGAAAALEAVRAEVAAPRGACGAALRAAPRGRGRRAMAPRRRRGEAPHGASRRACEQHRRAASPHGRGVRRPQPVSTVRRAAAPRAGSGGAEARSGGDADVGLELRHAGPLPRAPLSRRPSTSSSSLRSGGGVGIRRWRRVGSAGLRCPRGGRILPRCGRIRRWSGGAVAARSGTRQLPGAGAAREREQRRKRRVRSGGGSGELAARQQLVGSSSCGVIFFLFFQRATLSGGELTVLDLPTTIELDQRMLKTGGDVFLEPAVKKVNGVV